MALDRVCAKGHYYVQADLYHDWSEGAPYCSTCYKKWWKKLSKKKKKKLNKGMRKIYPGGWHKYYMAEE